MSAELNAIKDRVVEDFFKRGNDYVSQQLEWARLAAKAGIGGVMKFTVKAVGTLTPESAENLNRYVASVPRDCETMDEAFDYCREMNRPVIVRMPNGTTWKVFPSGTAQQIFLKRSD